MKTDEKSAYSASSKNSRLLVYKFIFFVGFCLVIYLYYPSILKYLFPSGFFPQGSPSANQNAPSYHVIKSPPKLILVSYDGFRWDYIARTQNAPTFRRLIQNGVYATRGLKNSFITITAPNHYGIVTGLYEESHGVVANEYFDPVLNETFDYFTTKSKTDPRFFGGEPIWYTNDLASGHRTGCVMWVGCDVAIKGHRPSRFISWKDTIDWRLRIDTLIGWFKDPTAPINLGLLYIEEPDETGHKVGPDSPEMTKMVEKLDNLTAYLLSKLEAAGLTDVNLIFTADHGMATVPYDNVVNVDQYVNRSWYTLFGGSPMWNILPKPGKVDAIYNGLSGKVKHATVYKKSTVPKQYHYGKANGVLPIQLYADIHWRLAYNDTSTDEDQYKSSADIKRAKITIRGKEHVFQVKDNIIGQHGYNNSLPDMHPYFIAQGPAFRTGFNISQFQNLDIFPLMCQILGVRCPPNNGSMLRVKSTLNGDWLKPPLRQYRTDWYKTFKHKRLDAKKIREIESRLPGSHAGYGKYIGVDLLLMATLLIFYICSMVITISLTVRASQQRIIDKILQENDRIFTSGCSDKEKLIT